jgi:hypothetical protein
LTYPGEYFGKQNLSRTIQNRFGFHYAADPMWEGIQHLPAEQPAEVTMGERSSNMFYTFAEQVRALALMRAVQKREAPKVCDEKASKKEIEAAAIELCHAYRPVRNAIDAFINDLLVAILQSLQPKSETFSPRETTRLAITRPVLFVEESGPSTNAALITTTNSN